MRKQIKLKEIDFKETPCYLCKNSCKAKNGVYCTITKEVMNEQDLKDVYYTPNCIDLGDAGVREFRHQYYKQRGITQAECVAIGFGDIEIIK